MNTVIPGARAARDKQRAKIWGGKSNSGSCTLQTNMNSVPVRDTKERGVYRDQNLSMCLQYLGDKLGEAHVPQAGWTGQILF